MLKRYFKTLDKGGIVRCIVGCSIFLLSCFITYVLCHLGHPIFGGVVLFKGAESTAKFLSIAMLGSIYRQREGKNKRLYLKNKNYLDARFEAVLENV